MSDVYNSEEEVIFVVKETTRMTWVKSVVYSSIFVFVASAYQAGLPQEDAASAVSGAIGLSALVSIIALSTAYLRKWSSQFTLTNERLTVSKGILGKQVDEVELYRIMDSKVKQGILQRILGVGDVFIRTTDGTGNLFLKNIKNPKVSREQVRSASNKERDSKNVRILSS